MMREMLLGKAIGAAIARLHSHPQIWETNTPSSRSQKFKKQWFPPKIPQLKRKKREKKKLKKTPKKKNNTASVMKGSPKINYIYIYI